MNDDTQPAPPTDQPSPPGPDAASGERIPDWLERIRARREAEAAQRRPAPPPPEPDPPEFEALPAPDTLPGWLRAAPDPLDPGEPRSGPAPSPDIDAALEAPVPAPESASPEGSAPADPPLDPRAEAPDWLKDAVAAKAAADAAVAAAAATAAAPAMAADATAFTGEDETEGEEALDPAARRQAVRAAREHRRQARRHQARRGSPLVNALKSLVVVGAAATLIATIFTFWTPASFLSDETREGLRPAYATLSAQSPPTPVPTPVWMRRIGIVSGHWGPHPTSGRDDPGAVCPDGFTEAEVNRNVAQRVVQLMSGRGYDVELLDEWDSRLDNYQASVLISIHADSCFEFDQPGATGFKVAPPASRTSARADDLRLQECLIREYGEITNLPLHPSLTRDMTEYHSFREIAEVTPANIIELGFLFEDRDMLENRPDLLAEGIVAGLLCFLENAPPTPLPELTPWPTLEATPTPLETPGLS